MSDWGAASAARLADDLRDAARDIADTAEPDRDAARLLAEEARRRARKVTGFMARHIEVTGPGRVEALAEYAPIVHEGWRGITPNPFMDQAVEAADWPAPYVEHVERQLEHNINRRY